MRRFIVDPGLLQGAVVTVAGDLYRHMVTVLRLVEGDAVILADGCGREAVGRIERIGRGEASLRLEDAPPPSASDGEGLRLVLLQGLPKGDKGELVLQKATELGAAEIAFFTAERSVPQLGGERLEKRLARWQRIVAEAARQSGRHTVPTVLFAAGLAELLQRPRSGPGLVLWEDERVNRFQQMVSAAGRVSEATLVVGPEGGLTAREVEAARSAGYQPVSLGPRVLRTETAALAALAVLQFVWGDLG
jgi:16S rRNA (uracil1498-N3)-methyltransferase